jgi:putative phage-type endonuclease
MPQPIKIDVAQGSAEWLALRKEKITASDCSSIMGCNPYKSVHQLFEEKIGLIEVLENDAMRRGTEMEPLAREAFINETTIFVKPSVYVSEKHDWMMASIDGYCEYTQTLVEIKCGVRAFKEAKKGIIAPYYQAQMNHQMEVMELSWMYYYAFNGKEGILMKFDRDFDFVSDMIVKEKKFYDDMINLIPPSEEEATVEDILGL